LFFMGLLLMAVILEPLAEKLRLPFSIVLILLGFVGSEIVTGVFSVDTGIRWDNFQFIIFHIFLPILIFQSAIKLDVQELWKNALPIFLLALPFMMVAAVITASILYFSIGHPVGFPWIIALLAGVLLSATDPSAVIALLAKSNTPKRIKTLLEGESLFNDATAVVLFTLLLAVASGSEEMLSWQAGISRFSLVFFGGITVGIIVGILAWLMLKYCRKARVQGLVTLLTAYSAFIIAEDLFHFSGVMAVLAAGLFLGKMSFQVADGQDKKFTEDLWEFAAHVTELLIFLLAGVTITLTMFTDQWLAMLIGILAVTVARVVIVFGLLSLFSRLPKVETVPLKHQVVLCWGGVRGTVTMALALSLPLVLESWFTVQSIAYGVVIFTLFVQTATMGLLLNLLKLKVES
jgi:Na+:H+ antiporter